MPPKTWAIQTVEDVIFYYYAKYVVAPSAGLAKNYGFIKTVLDGFRGGDKTFSDYDRELLLQLQGPSRACVYCGAQGNLARDHVIPQALVGDLGLHSTVFACTPCNSSKGDKDCMRWWIGGRTGKARDARVEELADARLVLGVYLKLCYDLHKVRHTLKRPAADLLDIGLG